MGERVGVSAPFSPTLTSKYQILLSVSCKYFFHLFPVSYYHRQLRAWFTISSQACNHHPHACAVLAAPTPVSLLLCLSEMHLLALVAACDGGGDDR